MNIGGFIKVSLIDYPGKVSSVIFTQGCNFRCYYCHNPELVYPDLFSESMKLEEIFSFLRNRRGLIDGVVFCGGEPTLQKDLFEVVVEIKNMGYLVKIDTNGSNPEVLEKVLPFVDYVAMDIKAPLDGVLYQEICKAKVDISKIRKSMELLRKSNKKYEFRTTFDYDKISREYETKILKEIYKNEKYVRQYVKENIKLQMIRYL